MTDSPVVDRLQIQLYGSLTGYLRLHENAEISMVYAPEWIKESGNPDDLARNAHAISLSLPIQDKAHSDRFVAPFMAGLLPDSLPHRRILAGELGIEDNPSDFAFLKVLGRDCAGAITIQPENSTYAPSLVPHYQLLNEADLAEFIRTLPQRPLMIDDAEGVRLSLAGVNDKAAVLMIGKDQLALPQNGFPSTHIIKPDINGLPDSIRVEHFCLRLAANLGIEVPRSQIRRAEDIIYMLMSRYDRKAKVEYVDGKPVTRLFRIHQEDSAQALGVFPARKYERNGGPSWKNLFDLMDSTVMPAQARSKLLDRAIFQFLSGNPDAHAKNYSLVYRPNGEITLSPFYDLNNAAAYVDRFKTQKPIMAMSIGGEFNHTLIRAEHWTNFAEEINLDREGVINRLNALAKAIGPTVASLRNQARGTLADSPRLDLVVADINARAGLMLKSIGELSISVPGP